MIFPGHYLSGVNVYLLLENFVLYDKIPYSMTMFKKSEIIDFDGNFGVYQNIWLEFDKIFNFCLKYLVEISISSFEQYFAFCQHFDFCQKFRFLSNTSSFGQHSDFCQKFLWKISSIYHRRKKLYLSKVFGQNCNFNHIWLKYHFSPQLRVFSKFWNFVRIINFWH